MLVKKILHESRKAELEDLSANSSIELHFYGDTSADLLWRLENGEAPLQQSRAIFLHIGINDLNEVPGFEKKLNLAAEEYFSDSDLELHGDEEFESLANSVYLGIEAVVRKLLMSCQIPICVDRFVPNRVLMASRAIRKGSPPCQCAIERSRRQKRRPSACD
mmetsp:Transcript_10942/g.18633  ORF Transcript_10942/g.18633 Transcript_10942/m.18633 type:complete len:162 (+) Transcript_10942:356-841(+)